MAFEVRDHQLLVVLGNLLNQRFTRFLVAGLELRRHVFFNRGVIALTAEPESLLLDEVDDAVEVGFGAPGNLDRNRVGVQTVDDHLNRAPEVGAGAVHLVDEADARHVVLVRLAPHRLGLGLDTSNGVEHYNATVEDAQGALNLDREVDVSRGVNDVDLVAIPLSGRRGRRNRDAALALLGHPVHDGGAFVDFTNLVGTAGVVKDPLSRRGLASVDVSNDADVTNVFYRVSTGHTVLPAVMYEGAVRLRHAVSVFSALNGCALTARGVCQFTGQLFGH